MMHSLLSIKINCLLETRHLSHLFGFLWSDCRRGCLWLSVEEISKACLDTQLLNCGIGVLSEWIQIEANCTSKQGWILSNDSNLGPHLSNVNLVDINAINEQVTSADLHNSGHGLRDGRLSCASSAHNSHLVSWSHVEAEILEDELRVGSIPQVNPLELNKALVWPLSLLVLLELHEGSLADFLLLDPIHGHWLVSKLLRDLLKVEETLNGDHLSLNLAKRTHSRLEHCLE